MESHKEKLHSDFQGTKLQNWILICLEASDIVVMVAVGAVEVEVAVVLVVLV